MMIGTPPCPTAVGSPAGHSRPSVSALYPPHYDAGGGTSCPIWDSRVGHFLWQERMPRDHSFAPFEQPSPQGESGDAGGRARGPSPARCLWFPRPGGPLSQPWGDSPPPSTPPLH